jgi:adenosine deaminase
MPLSAELLARRIGPLARDPATNFRLNDLLGTLVADPTDVSQVGDVLGNASLKYLLEARVRCLLGTDADGVEHSDIVKEYEYAASLIAYWNRSDPAFWTHSGRADRQSLFTNVRWHLENMASDTALAY